MLNRISFDQYHGTGVFRSTFFDDAGFHQFLFFSTLIIDVVGDGIYYTVDDILCSGQNFQLTCKYETQI